MEVRLVFFQIVGVARPLCSASKVCDVGNSVTFEAHGGFFLSLMMEAARISRES